MPTASAWRSRPRPSLESNSAKHGETGETPHERWQAGIERIRFADEERLRRAFLWSEKRTTDKAGVFSLFGTKYQVSAELARKRIEIRFDPEALDEIETWRDGRLAERVRPFQVQRRRRPRPEAPPSPPADAEPATDWLGHLVIQRRKNSFIEPTPRQLAEQAAERRQKADEAILALLQESLEPTVVDGATVREYLRRYGPFDAERAAETLAHMLDHERNDHHVHVYLDAIREGESE